ncbi:MAG: hypothetical protein HWD62_13760 [Cyclobacteriaceae bacterium]|nr:MAG: hypothetical protein HWD62_13760 [Cyclobacteriaceae bacterium]
MKYVFILVLTTCNGIAWAQNALPGLPAPKRFIDKIEIFAGPNLSFNYGNMFIENYNDDNVTNKRLLKLGYLFGLGIYHPVKDRLDISLRLQYEEKGTNSEMVTPGLQINSDYLYKYLSASMAPRILFGKRKNSRYHLVFTTVEYRV